jgi:putative ATP-binding cassette transporter
MNMKQKLWKNFWALTKPYWTSEEKWVALLLLAGVIFCNIVQVRLLVIFNSWNKVFYDALQAFSMHYVLLALLEFVIILILAILIYTYVNYLGSLLTNRWRKWMTHQYVDKWLDKHTAYAMQILNKNMDNPDQRISEDLNELPTLSLNLFSGLFNSALTFVSFSVVLWGLSGDLKFNFAHHDFSIPGYMFWITLIYASIGTVITAWIGKDLMRLNYQREQVNANFRFGLIRVRESAEQIALYKGQKTEKYGLKAIFEPVFKNYLDIIILQKYLGFFVNGYSLLIQVVGVLIALPRYIHEKLQIGILVQVGNAFGQVVGALSFVVTSFATIANWRAVIFRLTEFTRLMDEAKSQITKTNLPAVYTHKPVIEVQSLSLTLPSHQLLTDKLNFVINQNEHILITGKYGSGKSVLMRAMANIWPYSEGIIHMPEANMLFLPQKPYFPLGTLKQALLYPHHENEISDEEIKAILDDCGLSYFNKYLHEVRYWPLELSLGEQQLIAFARIFIVKPQWVFLDEATSALDEETEKNIYQLLQKRFPRMTIVSVGHRSSLKQFHQKEIYVEKQERV